MKKKFIFIIMLTAVLLTACASPIVNNNKETSDNTITAQLNSDMETIYFAGGCFWGVEEYFSRVDGVFDSESGYANGNTENPTYTQVSFGNTGHAETVKVIYDPSVISLDQLVLKYLQIVNPFTYNKQGNDIGEQYRTGIYYLNEIQQETIETLITIFEAKKEQEVAIEILPLDKYYIAEEYHQDYLQKNPNGYCHISFDSVEEEQIVIEEDLYPKPTDEQIKAKLMIMTFLIKKIKEFTLISSLENLYSHQMINMIQVVDGQALQNLLLMK
jgi:peptide methionine sulfoxide reductase msrA/msrB